MRARPLIQEPEDGLKWPMSPRNPPPLPDEEFRESVRIEVEPLADRKEAIPLLAKWFEGRWPEHYGPGGQGNAGLDLSNWCNRDQLPITLVAILDGEVSGTVTLKSRSPVSHLHLSPWLAMLLVPSDFQRKGVELNLVFAVEELASRLGIEALFASTATESPLLTRRSWQILEKPAESSSDLFIYRLAL